MKTVLLLRHAESEATAPTGEDADRALAEQGRKAATAMGGWLESNGLWPDHVLCSDALRARETLEALLKAADKTIDTDFRKDLYLAQPGVILAAIHSTPPERRRVMVVGHNPGIGALAEGLSTPVTRSKIAALGGFPTTAYVEYDFEGENWTDVWPDTGIVVRAASPKIVRKKD